MARPGRFELPTPCFGGTYSIHLSYGRAGKVASSYAGVRRRNPPFASITETKTAPHTGGNDESLGGLNGSLAGAGRVLCQKCLRAAPEELQSCEDGNQRDGRFESAGGNNACQSASQ